MVAEMDSWDWPTIAMIAAVVASSAADRLASRHTKDAESRQLARTKRYLSPLSLYTPVGFLFKVLSFALLGASLYVFCIHILPGGATFSNAGIWPLIVGAGVVGITGSLLGHLGLQYIEDEEVKSKYRHRTLFAPLSCFSRKGRKFQILSRLLIALALCIMIAGMLVILQ